LLVFSRIKFYDNDRELRFKIKALQKTDPKHFGVNQYLILNDKSPIVDLAVETEYN